MAISSTWTLVTDRLRGALAPEEYATWIAPLKVKSESEGSLVLSAPNGRFVHTVEENYRDAIDREAAAVHDELFQILIAADDGEETPAPAPAAPAVRLNPKYTFDTSSSEPRTSSPTPRRAPLPKTRAVPTTRCSSTASRASARPTCCTRSGTTCGRTSRTATCVTSRPKRS